MQVFSKIILVTNELASGLISEYYLRGNLVYKEYLTKLVTLKNILRYHVSWVTTEMLFNGTQCAILQI